MVAIEKPPQVQIASDLVYRYCRALDRLDADLLRSCFHDDAFVDMGAIYKGGPSEFVPVAMKFMGGMAATRHVVGNILAVGGGFESYVDAWHLIGREGSGWRELLVRGRYLQRIGRRGEVWALTYHSEVIDFGRERATDRGWFDGNSGLPKGVRGRNDPSYKLQEEKAG